MRTHLPTQPNNPNPDAAVAGRPKVRTNTPLRKPAKQAVAARINRQPKKPPGSNQAIVAAATSFFHYPARRAG